MQHTYLRYECADAFSLSHSASSTANSLSFLTSPKSGSPTLLSTAGSQIIGYDIRRGLPTLKIGHHDPSNIGTGLALNGGEVLCLDVSNCNASKVATGWADGSVRVFSIHNHDATVKNDGGLVRSLLQKNTSNKNEALTDPLTLNGHSSPVQIVSFEKTAKAGVRLASGSTDGTVILWDIVAESGLFRLLGHTGPITGIEFLSSDKIDFVMDGLATSGSDGLVKVWDLNAQCCIQTLVGHRGSVGCLSYVQLSGGGGELGGSGRLITGCVDGQIRVWKKNNNSAHDTADGEGKNEDEKDVKAEDIFSYMGSLHPPSNLIATSNEGIASIHFHGKYLCICRSNDRVIEVYTPRSEVEVQKKRKRRLQRRREKMNAVQNAAANPDKGKKRGILDDSESEEENADGEDTKETLVVEDHDAVKAMDEFEFRGTVRSSHKIRAFAFVPATERGGGIRIAVALTTNAFEVYSLPGSSKGSGPVTAEKVSTLDMYGHPTGIRSVALSSEDSMACTVSKNVVKVWNVSNRSCLRSLTVAGTSSGSAKTTASYYCLCVAFLPGNTHIVLGTREGHLLIMDVASGDLVYMEENAHDGAIWSLDLHHPGPNQDGMAVVTGSADKQVKFWDIESQDDDEDDNGGSSQQHPMVVHARTLQMTDDVMCVRYSHSTDPSKRLVFVASLDSTIKVFFDDSLKFFLSLYGHKLPVLAFDCSDDDTILGEHCFILHLSFWILYCTHTALCNLDQASGGADKSIKIWGLDFGDTHRTLYGHDDSITDLRFVKRTHNFFTCSKDKTVRFWDGDRFEQILLLNGHASEVCCLAMSRTGAFVISGGMDRQVRVWERTKDMVFLDEEKERRLEEMFDRVDGKEENTADVLLTASKNADGGLNDDEDEEEVDKPQSEAAVKQSILSVSAGDRIMEAIEMADRETKEIAQFKKLKDEKSNITNRAPNPMMFGMDPPSYVLWVLRSVKSVDLEASLLVLSLNHVERLMYYLILLLRAGKGIELCAKIAVFLVKAHQAQVSAYFFIAFN
jgi:U3 small nucleolar RNA-associated protein 12